MSEDDPWDLSHRRSGRMGGSRREEKKIMSKSVQAADCREGGIFPQPSLVAYSSTVGEERTYSHRMLPVLQRDFCQFRQDLTCLIRLIRLRRRDKKHGV